MITTAPPPRPLAGEGRPAPALGRRTLYPPLRPHAKGMLEVSARHSLYWETSGDRAGRPILFLHGGPGGGTSSDHRRYFDPEAYRIVMFDQRGCGKSTPRGCIDDNTTWDMVEDVERLRRELGIERWLVAGGSWGSALALAYATSHPERVQGLVLWGIFLLRDSEVAWFYQHGASVIFPDAWESFLAPIPAGERDDLVGAYYRRLAGEDPDEQLRAARAWSVWEAAASKLVPDPELVARFDRPDFALAFARVECHYVRHRGFFDQGRLPLDRLDRIRETPAVIVQGRWDVVCPMATAWELHRRWPEADFQVLPTAGHAMSEVALVDALVRATDRFRGLEAAP